MKEVVRSNNPVFISWLMAILNDAGIENELFDMHTALVEGSITAVEKRLMVSDEDFDRAVILVKEAETDFTSNPEEAEQEGDDGRY